MLESPVHDQHNHSIGTVFQNASTIVSQEMERLQIQTGFSAAEIDMIKIYEQHRKNHHPVQHAGVFSQIKSDAELQQYLSTFVRLVEDKSPKE